MRRPGVASDPAALRDLEVQHLKRQLVESRAREQAARAEERERFSALSSASKRFASSMRARMEDKQRQQRRTDAQYAVSRILEDSHDLAAAAPKIFRAFGERLGWKVGVLWTVEANALRCQGMWFARGRVADGFEEATRGSRFPRGAGLPGRAWEREEPCWVEDVLEDAGFLRQDAAVAAGLRCALAFPIQDGVRLVGVFELLKGDPSPADEDLLRASYLVGHQMGQFVERRRAEYERDHALVSEREARHQASEVLESINDAFFAVDRDWRFTYVNHRAEEFWSRSRRDIVGKKLWDELPQAVGTDIGRELHRAMGAQETVGFESVSPTTGVWISVRAYPSPNGLSVYFQDISERQRAEAALRESEERYRTLFETIDEGFCVVDVAFDEAGKPYDYRFLETNPAFARHTGLRGAAGKWMRELAPDHEEHWFEIYGRVASTGEDVRFVNEAKALEGRWFDVYAFRLGDQESRRVAILFNDITERRHTEQSLRESEERFRTLIAKGADMITVSDRTGKILYASPTTERVSGYAPEEFAALHPFETIHPEDRPRCEEALRRLGDEPGLVLDLQHRFRHKNGEWRWLEGTFASMFHDPAIGGLVANVRDVTPRKQAEEALRENAEWLRIAQRAAKAGTWEWDLVTGEVRWSDEHRDLFGFDPEAPVAREAWWAAIHPEDLPRIEEAGRRSSEEGEEWPEVEYRILRGGEVRWIDARGSTVRDREGRPTRILGISVDVTERKQAERERDRLRAQEWVATAEAAERERISRELHDRVAHSMAVVHQSLQLHDAFEGRDASRAASKLELAKELSKTALESTRNLSAELRRSDAETDLEAELRNFLEVGVPPGVRARLSVEGDESGVPGYVRGQLFLMLREAVRNAVVHSGCESVSVELEVAREEIVGRVEDDGHGFEIDGGHEGVGLKSMRERAALLDGDLDLTCETGLGTLVEISIPLNGGR